MPKPSRTPSKSAPRRSASGGTGKLFLGLLLGCLLTLIGLAAYLRFGNPPVAATDKAALWEPMLLSVPLNARARAEAKPAPFPESEDAFEGAARTYRSHCAACHGTPGNESSTGRAMVPHAPQFFSVRDRKATAAQSPGELYWKTAYGIRRSGMPAYGRTLTDTQLWQLSQLLHATSDDLPDPVRTILTQGTPPPQPTVVTP